MRKRVRDITTDIIRRRFQKRRRKTNGWLIGIACLVIGLVSIFQIVHINKLWSDSPVALSQTSSPKPPEKSGQNSSLPKTQQPTLSIWRGNVYPLPTQPGLARVFDRIPTNDPVVFLTIDDGITHDRQILEWLTLRHLPFSLFLDNAAIKDSYAYFRHLQTFGMLIENHTLTHPRLPTLNLPQQQAEICGAADTYAKVFVRRPTLFRPPYGLMNANTLQAVTACGMHAVVMWDVVVDAGAIQYQSPNTHLQPGDIVLMHFKPDFLKDIQVFSAQVSKDHLQIARLEDWLK
jgi:peptidoglycan/xylan/chitin deacetylase (PgdA/CDA1 family)